MMLDDTVASRGSLARRFAAGCSRFVLYGDAWEQFLQLLWWAPRFHGRQVSLQGAPDPPGRVSFFECVVLLLARPHHLLWMEPVKVLQKSWLWHVEAGWGLPLVLPRS